MVCLKATAEAVSIFKEKPKARNLKKAGLFVGDETRHCQRTLVGIVSLGASNCAREIPIVFTRVSSFIKWIDEKMAEN